MWRNYNSLKFKSDGNPPVYSIQKKNNGGHKDIELRRLERDIKAHILTGEPVRMSDEITLFNGENPSFWEIYRTVTGTKLKIEYFADEPENGGIFDINEHITGLRITFPDNQPNRSAEESIERLIQYNFPPLVTIEDKKH